MRNPRSILLVLVLLCGAWLPRIAHAQDGTPVHVVPYTVQPGDTTSGIAEYFYDDQGATERIAAHNRLANINRIRVGQVIEIPFYDIEAWEAYATRAGIPLDMNAGVSGGSADVAVAIPQTKGHSRRFWAIVGYGTLSAVLTGFLYMRSRFHEHAALGVGAAHK